MYRKQMKAQKILSYLMIGVAAVLFIATLGMSTDLFEILKPCLVIENDGFTVSQVDIEGAMLYMDIQDFNKLAVKLAIALIVISLLMFISNSHIRRKYYIFNYIAIIIVVGAFIGIAVYIMKGAIDYKNQFLTKVDFEALKEYADSAVGKLYHIKYSKSTFWLDFNIFACVLVIISAGLAVLNTIWKIILEINEKKLLNTGKAEVA